MDKFLSVFRAYSPERPLRPLLLATGAAAAAAGIYCLVKWTDGNKMTANPEDTSDPGDPVCNGATEPALVRLTEVVQDQMKVFLANAEEQHQKDLDTINQLEQNNSDLTDQVKSLQDTMKDMWNQLCDTQLQCDKIKKECEQEQEAHRLMKSEYQEMMETLTDNEKLLKVLLAEAEEKHQKAVETITQLEQEKSNQTDQVKSLQDTVKDMWNQLCDTQLQCDELKKECKREQEAHNLLKVQYREMMETNSETVLKASLAEADKKHQKAVEKHQKAVEKLQKAVETITQLEQEKSNLTYQVKTLQNTMQDMGNQLCDTQLQCDKIKKDSMAEAEEKHQKAVETITQLEQEKSNQTDQVKSLQDTVKDMWNQLCDTQLQCDELKKECKREQEAHNLLKVQYREMMETNSETVLKASLAEADKKHQKAVEKHQKAVETITQLEQEKSNLTYQVKTLQNTMQDMGNQLCDTQLQCDKIKKDSMAEAEEKHQKAVETITQLEQEKSNLTDQVKSLQDTMKDMWNQLCDTQLQCDKIKKECEQEQEAHRLMKSEYQEMMETLTDNEKLLKVLLAEAEEKHQKAVETITQLEQEKSNLTYQVKTLQNTMQDMGNQLCDTQLQCDELKKASLAEADKKHQKTVEKHQKAVETITQLEQEKSNLTYQVKTLQNTMQDMGNQLCDTQLQCDELKKECKTEQEAHNLLKVQYREMMETNSETVLKASLAEADKKHQKAVEKLQKAVETITQLEQEKSNLTYQVKTLQNTMQDMGNQLCDTQLQCDKIKKDSMAEAEEKHQKAVETITQLEQEKTNLTDQVKSLQDTMKDMWNQLCDTQLQCDELKKECKREQEAHNLLKVQYREMMETNSETVLKASLAEADKKHQKAVEKHQKAVETITQLEQEKTNLTYQVKTLQNTMQDMGNQLCDTQLQCDKIKKDSMAEAEEKHQKAVETITQLEQEKSNLTDQVKSLQDTMKDMWNQLCDTQLQCDKIKKECEQEQEAHRLMKSEYQEMMETLTDNEKLLKVLLAEAEEKHQKAVETITQLEQEKSNLTYQVKTLQNTMQDMGNQLCDTQLQCDELKKASLALADKKHQKTVEKHQKAVETITQLEQEKSNLTYQVKTLQNTMQDMGNQLCDTQLQCDELKKECKTEQEAHNLLKVQYREMMETNSETVLKASLAEADKKHQKAVEKLQKAVETITQLEQEKSNLTYQVKTLQNTMQDMGNQLCDTQLQCDELKKECEQEQETHRLLKVKFQEMMETLTDSELLKDSLAEAEEKHQKAVETITQLEQEKSILTDQVKSLRETTKDMWNHLSDTQLQCDKIKKECKREQEAHNLLKVQYREMMETNSETVLKASLAEAEEKHQKAVETITQLEQEKTNLTDQVKSLKDIVWDMWIHLSDTQLQCDELKNESEREQEAHNLLQLHYHEMMETLTNSETVLKDSMAEAEEKHQKAVETITQLEQEKTNQTDQVKSLKDIVWDMWIHLSDTQLQCDELKKECEQEQEAHKPMMSEYQEMMETLTDSELQKEHVQQLKGHSTLKMEKDELKQSLTLSQHLLKESPNQAEEKHQNAVQSTDELEAEMSDLKTHMDPVRQTRGDKIKRMFLKICKSDKCLGTKDTESSVSQSGTSSESV